MFTVFFLFSSFLSTSTWVPWKGVDEKELETVYIRGDIDEATATQFAKDMARVEKTGQPIILVEIDSYGGYIYSYLSMADTISKCKVPVATICNGKCMSAGALILLHGTEGYRFITPRSTVLIHDVASVFWGKLPEIQQELDESKRLAERTFIDAALKIGRPPDYFLKMLEKAGHKDIYFSAEQAQKAGLVNKVGWPTFEVQTHVLITVP